MVPRSGEIFKLGVVMASENPYDLDNAVCRMMGFDINSPPIMAETIARGLTDKDFSIDMIDGDTECYKVIENFKFPEPYSLDFSKNVPKFLQGIIPVLQKMITPKPAVLKDKCIGCEKCKEICPCQIITMTNKIANIKYKKCIKCFCCHEICPVKAMDVKRFLLFK